MRNRKPTPRHLSKFDRETERRRAEMKRELAGRTYHLPLSTVKHFMLTDNTGVFRGLARQMQAKRKAA